MARPPRSQPGSFGKLTYRPASDEGLVPQALEFIRRQLPVWRDDPRRPEIASETTSERLLNFSLCRHLNRCRADHPMFQFEHETPQTGSRTVDIGVFGTNENSMIEARSYSSYEPFLVVEAKRLPAPSKDREREYVTGTDKKSGGPTGGIQRFKLGLHGAEIEAAVMVGYIESNSPQHWLTVVNKWIRELATTSSTDACVWTKAETLQAVDVDEINGVSASTSAHQRLSGCVTESILLHHYWIVMNPSRSASQDSAR